MEQEEYESIFKGYEYPTEGMEFVGQLIFRKVYTFGGWRKTGTAVICFFVTADGRKLRLHAFKENGIYGRYTPKDGKYDFLREAVAGSTWRCRVEEVSDGKTAWISAELEEINDEISKLSNELCSKLHSWANIIYFNHNIDEDILIIDNN